MRRATSPSHTFFALAGSLAAGLLLAATAVPAQAQNDAPGANSLFELLDLVERGLNVEREENLRRVARFESAKEEQERLLAEARAELAAEEAMSEQVELDYNANEVRLAEDGTRLTERLGQLGELFGVVRQVSTETSGNILSSLTSAQYPGRDVLLDRLGRSKELPTTQDLEALWFELQREMTEQGQVVRFDAPVLTLGGDTETWSVIRAGPFATVGEGRFLLWEPREGKLRELSRQPPAKYLGTVAPFEAVQTGFASLAVDPSRGSLLEALTDTPNATERVNQGGAVGYVIIGLGLFALAIGLVRWLAVFVAGRGVRAQRKKTEADTRNPLGRILAIYEENRQVDPETLELKLDEAVLRETSKLEKMLWIVKTVSVVAPLLGLLGTVTGMIQTFQSITLFGAGDPKMMAGGISEALVTTMLGLLTAIPLVLLYETLANSTSRIIDTLDEQSAGLIASRSEATRV